LSGGVVVVEEETSIFGPSSSSSDLLRAFRLSGHTETDRQRDRETERQTDRQTGAGRQTETAVRLPPPVPACHKSFVWKEREYEREHELCMQPSNPSICAPFNSREAGRQGSQFV